MEDTGFQHGFILQVVQGGPTDVADQAEPPGTGPSMGDRMSQNRFHFMMILRYVFVGAVLLP